MYRDGGVLPDYINMAGTLQHFVFLKGEEKPYIFVRFRGTKFPADDYVATHEDLVQQGPKDYILSFAEAAFSATSKGLLLDLLYKQLPWLVEMYEREAKIGYNHDYEVTLLTYQRELYPYHENESVKGMSRNTRDYQKLEADSFDSSVWK